MNREEAIAVFKGFKFLPREMKAVEIAISDMEKNIPKKPTPINYEQYAEVVRNAHSLRGFYWCPNCNTAVKSGRYCVNCGQLLDWSDEE